jgi:flavin-dependent dehydrogenase
LKSNATRTCNRRAALRPPVIVIGGGPAGSICALQLARLGHSVTLAERSAGPSPQLGETCGPRIKRVLEGACNLSLPRTIYRPLDTFLSAWGSDEVDVRNFVFWQAESGLVLDRTAFNEWLLSSAESAGVNILRGCHMSTGWPCAEGWTLKCLIDGREQMLSASFIVEATGPRARSVVQPGVTRFFTDALVCLSVELCGPSSEHPTVMVESCAAGWWYLAELIGGRQIVALFTDADMVAAAETRSEWFNSILDTTSHIRRLVHDFPKDARVRVCDARTSVRNILWRDAWLSIGDAVWCLDPLSGAGIERAINDGISAANAISRALTVGDAELLRAHAVSRAHSFRESLAAQRSYYGAETRWRETVFWHRRM